MHIAMGYLVDGLYVGHDDESYVGALTDMARDGPTAERISS